jgi:hypothetical protein
MAVVYPIAMVWDRMDDAEQSTRVMAESGYLPGIEQFRKLKTTWVKGPHGDGAIANVIRTDETQLARNTQTDPHYAPWREHLMGNGEHCMPAAR